jgi:putative membrane protein
MNTEKKSWISDRSFFWLVVGISLAVPAVVVTLRFLPDEFRPNARFAMHLPKVNAILNSMVSIALICGYIAIKRSKNRAVHKTIMLTAFVLSALFLVSYVLYHMVMPSTPYCNEGFLRYLYFFILLTHILLAAIILPLVLYTIYFSTSGNLVRHRKIARWTFPLWLYVSVTGVLVYVLISPCYPF